MKTRRRSSSTWTACSSTRAPTIVRPGAPCSRRSVRIPHPEHWRLTIGRPSEEAVPLLLGRRALGLRGPTARAAQAGPLRRFRAKGHRHRGRGEPLHRRSRAPEGPAGRRHLRLRLRRGSSPRGRGAPALLRCDRHRRRRRLRQAGSRGATCSRRPACGWCRALHSSSRTRSSASRRRARAGMRAIGVTTAHTVDELTHAGAGARGGGLREGRVAGDRAPVSTPAFWGGTLRLEPGRVGAGRARRPSSTNSTPASPAAPARAWPCPGPAAATTRAPRPPRLYGDGLRLRRGGGGGGATARRAREATVTFEQRDVFGLGSDFPHAFDAAWEYTCFCAIDPERRAEYAQVLHDILKPGGVLLACFYPLKDGTDGPPFPCPGPASRRSSPPLRYPQAGPPAASPERRRGLEWLVTARRRSS